jgi:uncharacterized membrane protein
MSKKPAPSPAPLIILVVAAICSAISAWTIYSNMQTQQFPTFQPWTYQYQDLWYKSLPSAFAVHCIAIVIALLLTGYSAFLAFSEGNSADLRVSKSIVAGIAVVWT